MATRRLHTVMSALLEDLLFDLPEVAEKRAVFDRSVVHGRLQRILKDEDLRKFIL